MPMRLNRINTRSYAVLALASVLLSCSPQGEARVLVFSKTETFRHESIGAGIAAIRRLGAQHGFSVDATEDAAAFTVTNLQRYGTVIFLNSTGDLLDDQQQTAFEGYIQAGGGFVGIHAAADAEYDWPWYGKLVGAYFDRHPPIQTATLMVLDSTHPSTESLPESWERTDEWYDFKSINPDIHVLITIDESTYTGASTGPDHPMAWCHEFDGGRAFYTGGGHTDETFSEEAFLAHLAGGINWVLRRW